MKALRSSKLFDTSLLSIIENANFVKKPKIHYSLKIEPENTSEIKPLSKPPELTPEKTFEIIRKMRKDLGNAPVDLLGSHLQFQTEATKDTQGFQLLTSLVLSAQTKDQTTDLIMKRLLEKGLNIDFINEIDVEQLKNLIYEANFNNNKAKYLKNIAQKLKTDYNGKMPETYEETLKLPGVGPKMAILYMLFHFNKCVGISVDTHVHRISNRLQWVKTKTPEETRKKLEEIFEEKVWKDVNEVLVGFGQMVCLPINPKCDECLLKDICPEGIKNTKGWNVKGKKTKKK